MAKKLTKKQRGFVEDYILTENATEAASKNYDVKNRNVANNIGAENLARPSIIEAIEVKRQSLQEALEQQGITPKRIAEKVDVLLNASTPIYDGGEHVGEKADYMAIDKGLKHATAIYGVKGDMTAIQVNLGTDRGNFT